MIATPIHDELMFALIVVQDEQVPACQFEEHAIPGFRYRHDGGPARFELLMPCGFAVKACAGFVAWLRDYHGTVKCASWPDERHDLGSLVVVPL